MSNLMKILLLSLMILQIKPDTCPTDEIVNFANGQCITSTSCSGYKYSSICYPKCPPSTYEESNNCVERCDSNSNNYIDEETKKCTTAGSKKVIESKLYTYCPNGQYDDGTTCTTSCSLHFNYKCVASCPVGTTSNYNACQCSSTTPKYDEGICKAACPNERPYYDPLYNECHSECYGQKKYHNVNSYECLVSCASGSIYEFNYVCYTSCPSLTVASGNSCKCTGKFFKKPIGGDKIITTCLEDDEPCPSDKQYLTTEKECVEVPPTSGCSFLRKSSTNPQYYICISGTNCANEEYEYQLGYLENPKFCLSQCPLDKPYKDLTSSAGSNKKCVASCENNYVDETSKVCLVNCPGLNYFDANNKKIKGKCISETECPASFPYLYTDTNTCLRKCDLLIDTDNVIGTNSDYYVNDYQKECYTSNKCPSGTFANCEDLTGEKKKCSCVKNCKTYDKIGEITSSSVGECTRSTSCSNGVLLEETNECLAINDENKSKYYYTYNSDTIVKFYLNGCPENHYVEGKKCHSSAAGCHTNNYYADKSNEKCVICSRPTNDNLPGEGYHIHDTYTDNTYLYYCLSKCPDTYPYYLGNTCYASPSDIISKNNLQIGDVKRIYDSNKYVTSCTTGYYAFNSFCYYASCPKNTQIDCTGSSCICSCKYKYYEESTNELVCLNQNDPCPLEKKYFTDRKCDANICSYNMRKSSSNPANFECLANGADCEDDEFYYKVGDKKVCVSECPNNYPYHDYSSTDSKLCRDKCDDTQTYTDELNFLCYYNSCPDSGYNLLNTEGTIDVIKYGKCITGSTCPPDAPYLYRETKTCLSDCDLTQNHKIFFSNPPTPKKTYLDESTNICENDCLFYDSIETKCLNECGDLYLKEDNGKQLCVSACGEGYLSVIDLKQCVKKDGTITNCKAKNYYALTSNDASVCYKICPSTYYHFDGDSTDDTFKKCYQDLNSVTDDKHEKYGSDKKLVTCSNPNSASSTEQDSQKGYLYQGVCYDQCPDSAPFYSTGNNRCSGSCELKQKYGSGECLSSCTGELYEFNNVCYSKCPEKTEIDSTITNNCKCVDKYYEKKISSTKTEKVCLYENQVCPSSYPYYNPTTKECSSSESDCSDNRRKINNNGNIYYECGITCDVTKEYFYYQGSDSNSVKFCVTQCPNDKPYHHYSSSPTESAECLSKEGCSSYFRDDINFVCYDDCNLKTIDETQASDSVIKKDKCILENNCPPNKPYLYGTFCLSSCDYTSKYKFDSNNIGPTTKLDTSTNKCIDQCSSSTDAQYYDTVKEICVEKCRDDQFINGKNCYDSSNCGSSLRLKYGTNICVIGSSASACPTTDDDADYKYSVINDNRYCYTKCPEGTYEVDDNSFRCATTCSEANHDSVIFYIDETGKKCIQCSSKYLVEGSPSVCYLSGCPTSAPYHIQDGKKCYSTGCPIPGETSKKFLLESTSECSTSCDDNNKLLFNYVCYKNSCPEGTETSGDNACKCLYNYYVKGSSIGDLNICLSVNQPCPAKTPYILSDGKCISATDLTDDNCKKKRILSTSPINYKCEEECEKNEFVYDNGNSVTYCVSKCPENKPFYVPNDSNAPTCLESCSSDTYFTDVVNHLCLTNCPEKNSIIETTTNSGKKDKCIQTVSCPTSKPYLYTTPGGQKYCLSSCSSSSSIIGETTSLDQTTNECVSTSECTGKYKDSTTNNCVFQCASNQYLIDNAKYSKNYNICYNTCPNSGSMNYPYRIDELKLCVKDCKDEGYYSIASSSTDFKCYQTCPIGYYTDEANKKCYTTCPTGDGNPNIIRSSFNLCISTCKNPTNRDQPTKDEGFIVTRDTVTYCLDKCPDDLPYTNYNKNICYALSDSLLNKYQIAGTNMFIDDCSNTAEKTYLFNNVCYKECPENTKVSGSECECEEKYYLKSKPNQRSNSATDPTITEKVCLKVNEPCPSDKPYFGPSNNECIASNCKTGDDKRKKIINNGIVNYKCVGASCGLDDGYAFDEYCVEKCPESKPYHIINENTCYEDCTTSKTQKSNNYYADKTNYICYYDDATDDFKNCPYYRTIDESESVTNVSPLECLNECPESKQYKYIISDTKKYCLKSCSSVKKISGPSSTPTVNEDDKTCSTTCGTILFEDQGINPYQCVEACPEGRYFYKKICYPDCSNLGGDYIYETKQCLKNDDVKTGLYTLESTTSPTIYYQSCPTTDGTETLYQDDDDNKCKKISQCTGTRHAKASINKCVECSAPDDPNSIKEKEGYILSSGNCVLQCLSDQPFILYDSANKKYDNKCKTKTEISTEGKYYIHGTNAYTTEEKCPDDYPYLFNKECYKTECPDNTYSDENKNCKCSYKFTVSNNIYTCFSNTQSCPTSTPFFDEEKGCIEKCNVSPRTLIKVITNDGTASSSQCVSTCSLGEFKYDVDIKDNTGTVTPTYTYCVEKCPDDKKYHNFGETECLSNCDSDHYYTSNSDYICYSTCPSLGVIDENGKRLECISGTTCPNNYYLYDKEKVCLTNCGLTDTLTSIFGTREVTYEHEDSIKQCVSDCSKMTNNKYLSNDKKKCLQKCPDDELINDFYCQQNCQNLPNSSNPNGFYEADTRKCSICTNKFMILDGATASGEDKKCFNVCPEYDSLGNKLFHQVKDNNEYTYKCIKCTTDSTDHKGFYIEGDSERKCYPSCSTDSSKGKKYYITGDNKCIEKCSYPYLHMIVDNTINNNKCVISCGTDQLQENYKCLVGSTCTTADGFKEEPDSTKKCICNTGTSTDYNANLFQIIEDDNGNEIYKCGLTACISGKEYINTENKECVANCPSGTYTYEAGKKCFKDKCLNNNNEVIYRKPSTKQCISECKKPVDVTNVQADEGFYLDSDEYKNCYDKCPSTSPYYTADANDNKCLNECPTTGDYINKVEDRYECVKNCPANYYLFNKVCYKNCPSNSEKDGNECKCKFKHYKDEQDNLICLGEKDACPQDKNFYNSGKECTNTCDNIRKKSIDASDYECVTSCDDDFIYEVSVGANTIQYCKSECPNTYYTISGNDKTCVGLSGCSDKYIIEATNECADNIDQCNLYIYESDVNGILGKCLQASVCPLDPKVYYSYSHDGKTQCFASCPNSPQTYTDVEVDSNTQKTLYRCVTDCSQNGVKKYTDLKKNECVKTCGENGGNQFLYNYKCYESCSATSSTSVYYNEDTKECVQSCDGTKGYYTEESNKKCYKSTCPEYDKDGNPLYKKQLADNKLKCVKCNIPGTANAEQISDDEGFLILGDTTRTCYSKCPSTNPYYNKGKNICFANSCKDSSNPYPSMTYSKYASSDNNKEYVCYNKCNDAYSNWSTKNYVVTENSECVESTICPSAKYPYEYENVCYEKGCPSNDLKIEPVNTDNVIKCKNSCSSSYYLQGKNCVSRCTGDYIYRIEKTTSTAGICLKEACNTSIYPYYNKNDKECKSTCSDKKIETDTTTGRPFVSSEGTCVSSCPNDYPYEYNKVCYKAGCPLEAPFYKTDNPHTCYISCNSINDGETYYEDGNECVTSCSGRTNKYSFTDNNKNKCVKKCESPKEFYTTDNVCTSLCKNNDNKVSYYNPVTLECVDGCSSVIGYEFYVKNEDDSINHSPCMSECVTGSRYEYYYTDKKQCLTSCGSDFYSSSDEHICTGSCDENDIIIPAIKKCVTACNVNYPYLLEKNGKKYCYDSCDGTIENDNNLPYKFTLNSSKKCVTQCDTSEKYLYNNICYSKCPDEVPYYYEIDNTGIYQCVIQCSYATNFNYRNENSYQCLNKCTGPQNYIIEGKTICLNECPDNYLKYPVNNDGIIFCTKNCKINEVESNGICKSSCDDPNYPYEEQSERKCYSSCPDTSRYYRIVSSKLICAKSCSSSQYIFYGSKTYLNNYSPTGYHCVDECPETANYIGKNRQCKSICSSSDGEFYYLQKEATNYKIYTCAEKCNIGSYKYYESGKKECLTQCPDDSSYFDEENVCRISCYDKYPYKLEEQIGSTTRKRCVKDCSLSSSLKPLTDIDDKKCIASCSESLNTKITDENGKCVSSCYIGRENNEYKFTEDNLCKKQCSINKRFYITDYLCISKCDEGDFVLPSGECTSSCDKSSDYKFAEENDDKEIICKKKCSNDYPYYYDSDASSDSDKFICKKKCDNNDLVVQATKECLSECPEQYPIKYILLQNDLTFLHNSCVDHCTGEQKYLWPEGKTCAARCFREDGTSEYPYYFEIDKECKASCGYGYNFTLTSYGYICQTSCAENQFLDTNGRCIESCLKSAYKAYYYYETEKICLTKCKDIAPYMNDYECLSICPEDKPYANEDNNCVKVCNNKPYFVKDILDSETDRQMHCSSDCTEAHPYYLEETQGSNTVYACYKECPSEYDYFVQTSKKYAKQCLKECTGNTPFISEDNECVKKCDSKTPYYVYESGDKKNLKCLEKCPVDYYHDKNSYICKSACDTGYLYYYDKTNDKEICVISCTSKQYEFDPDPNSSDATKKKYCLDNCSDKNGFLTPDGQCVKECPTDIYTVYSDETNSCICKNLYYYDSSGIQRCLKDTLTHCSQNTLIEGDTSTKYNIPLEDSKQCLETCTTFISPAGYCYKSGTNSCPENTELDASLIRTCKCKYKFYKNEIEQNICLGKDEKCPILYDYLIYETNECVKTCTGTNYEKSFNYFCYKTCPLNSDDNNNDGVCECSHSWITDDDGNKKCLDSDDCPQSKPLYTENTKECSSKCPDNYPIFFGYKCRSNCDVNNDNNLIYTEIDVTEEDPFSNFAESTCRCNYLWYYKNENYEIECTDKDKNTENCYQFGSNLNLVVRDIGQCVESCPSNYSFRFNYECFSSCETNANIYYDDLLQTKNSNECECKYSFKKNTDNGKEIIECLNSDYCEDYTTQLYVVSTRECIDINKGCPQDNKYNFNGNCYKTCPENSIEDGNTCKCKNLWYKVTNSNTNIDEIICLKESINNCPSSKNYLSDETKECRSDYGDYPYIFNEKLYKKGCPTNTKKDSTPISTINSIDHYNCVCDPDYGYWYIDDSTLKYYLKCGLENCPNNKLYYIVEPLDDDKNKKNKCLHICKDGDDQYLNYKYGCYKDCPGYTVEKDNICDLKPLEEATDYNEFYDLISKSAVDYYIEENKTGGITIHKYGVSTQIFGIDKNIDDYKDLFIKDNLTYVDFGNCINKFYETNKIDENKKLVVVKMDVISNTYLVNPVEYEIYSPETGKKLDLTTCTGDIIISYPISEKLNAKTSRRLETTENNLRELFDLGKKLNEKDDKVDSFNSENVLYTDVCQSCVINGKDLILKERPDYLFPQKEAFCENNCTYYYTDFTNERINCKCSIKSILDIKRKHNKEETEIEKSEAEKNQKGNTNFPVLGCIKNFDAGHNGAFYYCLIILIIQIVMVILAFVIGYKSLKQKISKAIYGNEEINDIENYINNINTDNNNNNNINAKKGFSVDTENRSLKFKSSNINLNQNRPNPPPKTNSEFVPDDQLDMKNAEFIPNMFSHLFFSPKDNGVVKDIKRNKLPFSVKKTTKILYEHIDNAAGTSVKRNMIRIIENNEDEFEIQSLNNSKEEEKENKEDNKKFAVSLKDTLAKHRRDSVNQHAQPSNNQQSSIKILYQPKQSIINDKKEEKKEEEKKIVTNEILANNIKTFTRKELIRQKKEEEERQEQEKYKKHIGLDDFSIFERSSNEEVYKKDIYNEDDLYKILKREKRYKDLSYESAQMKDNEEAQIIILTFIIDKIYFLKTILFRRKYEIFSSFVCLYFVYHLLIISIFTMFFDVKKISKIFWEGNYPNLSFYLLYGFIANLISWVAYKLLCLLIKNNHRILQFIAKNYKNKENEETFDKNDVDSKLEKLMKDIFIKLIIFFVISMFLTLFLFFYLILFCSVYKGTKGIIFKGYGISLAEIVVIKIVYAVILGMLRSISLCAKSEGLYKFVKFIDYYLS